MTPKFYETRIATTKSVEPSHQKKIAIMPPKTSTGESPTKIQKRRNVVTVSEEFSITDNRVVPISEPFEIDQDDLRVLDELLLEQRVVLDNIDYDDFEAEFSSREQAEKFFMGRRCFAQSISKDENRRITTLKLWRLTGAVLPSSIKRLDALERLELSHCSNLIDIPEWIGQLKNLKQVRFPTRGSVTELPDEFFDLSNLENLFWKPLCTLQENPPLPIAIPDSIEKFTKLKVLHLASVSFLPQEIASLTSLEELELVNYRVRYLPTSISRLKSLKKLWIVDSDHLQSLPESIGQLKNLEVLHLEHNAKLKALPESTGHLTSLELLKISSCSLVNSFPRTIGNLPKLKHLILSENDELVNLPDCIGNISTLKTLNVRCTGISLLPMSVYNLKNLEHLDLSVTNLTHVPQNVCNLTNLRYLGLSSNAIEKLPELRDLKKLRYLTLDETPFHDHADWTPIEKLVKKYPWVNCFGDFPLEKSKPEHFAYFYELFSRKLKEKVLTKIGKDSALPLSFWPVLLARNQYYFAEAACDGDLDVRCSCCAPFDIFGVHDCEPPPRPTRSDVQFQILKEFGHKFLSSSGGPSKPTLTSTKE